MKHRIRPLYRELAAAIQARKNCQAKLFTLNSNAVSATVKMEDNEYHQTENWLNKHTETINMLVDHLPSGAGWNEGTKTNH